jgi:hypothetical protein
MRLPIQDAKRLTLTEPNFLLAFNGQTGEVYPPMPAAEWYHRKSGECVALAEGVRLNEERAGGVLRRAWALALNPTFEIGPEN